MSERLRAYVDGVEAVIALLPVETGDPAVETDDTASAVFFQKKDFGPQLDVPLRETLGSPPAAGEQAATAPLRRRIQRGEGRGRSTPSS